MTLANEIRRAYGLHAHHLFVRVNRQSESLLVFDEHGQPISPKDEVDTETLFGLLDRALKEEGGTEHVLIPYDPEETDLPWANRDDFPASA